MTRPLLASISQLLFSVIGKASFLIVTLLLYKVRSQEEMGALAMMLAVAMILATISECGMRGLLVREMARMRDEPEQATRLFAGAMQSRVYSVLPYFAVSIVAGLLLLPSAYLPTYMWVVFAVWWDSNAQVIRGALRAFDRIILDAILAALPRIVLLAVCAYFYSTDALTLDSFAGTYVALSIIDYFVSQLFVYRYTTVRLNLGTTHTHTMNLIKRGLPFIVLAVLGTIYIRVGVVLLGVPKTPEALTNSAAYSLSAKFPEGVAFVPIALMNVTIPFLSRQSKNLQAIREVFPRLEILTGGLGILIAVGLVAFAEELILLVSTPKYLPYTPVFRLYGATVFFSFVQYTYANLLLSLDKEHLVATRYGAVLVLNILLNLVLIWKFGPMGAVTALILCELAAMALDLWFLRGTGIAFRPKVLVIWAGIAVIAMAAGWLFNRIPGYSGLLFYGVLAGFAGMLLLYFTQISHSAQDVQTSSAAD